MQNYPQNYIGKFVQFLSITEPQQNYALSNHA